jgi:amino acid transporter
MARSVWGAGWVVVFLAIANSAIANSNAGSNAATRTWYSMGRIRLLPSALAHVHPKYKSPDVAVTAQLVVGIAVAVWLGRLYQPFPAFALLGTIIGAVIIAIYILVDLACLVYYLRERRSEFNWFLHGLVPVLGIVAFVPAFFTAIGVGGSVFSFVAALPYPFNRVGPVVGIWYILGVVYLIALYAKNPARIKETGKVFVEEAAAETSAPI